MKKCMKDVTFEEFSEWSNRRACDGKWGYGTAIICLQVHAEIMKVKPLFNRKKAREKKWQEIKKDYFNLEAEIEVN